MRERDCGQCGPVPLGGPSSGGTSDRRKTWLLSGSSPPPAPARIYKQRQQSNDERRRVSGAEPSTCCNRRDLKDESGGSRFMTVRMRVRSPFFPSHTRLLSVLTRASTSGMLAFMEMALSSFSSWLFSSRYLFLKKQKKQHGCG